MSAPAERCPACGGALTAGAAEGGAWCPNCALAAALGAPGDAGGGLFAVPGYEVVAELGRGATGIVYRARQLHPAREVALKILRPHEAASPEARARFRLEAGHVAALDHPAILPLLDVGEHDGLPYFTMKLCVGGTLAARAERYRRDPRAAAALVAELAHAVQHAHDRGVLHRDLKPGNIFFDEADRAFVGDFGLAKQTGRDGEALTQPQHVYGTPGYVAPEVLSAGAKQATVAADVYGLGAILHALLVGAPPPTGGVDRAQLRSLPRDLAAVCLRALAPEPADRYASAAALAADLVAWTAGRPVTARPPSAPGLAWSWARRNPLIATLAVALIVSLGTGAWLLVQKNRELAGALADSLLDQSARARARDWSGRRAAAVSAAARGAELRPSVAARSEQIAAAALSDFEHAIDLPHLPGRLWVAGDSELRRFVHVDKLLGGDLRAEDAAGHEVARYTGVAALVPLAAEFSSDDRWFVATFPTHSGQINAMVWPATGGVPVWRSAAGFAALALHPAGKGWFVASADRTVRWIAVPPATQSLASGNERLLATLGFTPGKIACDPTGTRLAIVGSDRLAVIDSNNGHELWHREGAFAVYEPEPAWSEDGRALALVPMDSANTIEILAAADGSLLQTLSEPGRGVRRIAFAADGRLLSLAMDDVLAVWSLASRRVELRLRLAEHLFALSRDGRRLMCTPDAGAAAVMAWAYSSVWRDFADNSATARSSLGNLATLAVSPGGRLIAAIDEYGLTLWDAATHRVADRAPFIIWYAPSLAFDTPGTALVYSDLAEGIYRREIEFSSGVPVLGPQETILDAPGWSVIANSAHADRLYFFDMKRRFHDAPGHAPWAPVLWFDTGMTSAEKRGFADDTMERVFAVNQQTRRGVVRHRRGGPAQDLGPVGPECAGRFSHDGRSLWLVDSGELRRFDCSSWQETGRWPVTIRNLPRPWLNFSPDGRSLALAIGDGAIDLRDTATGATRIVLTPPHALPNYLAAWSPDSRRLWVCGDGPELHEWNLAAIGTDAVP